jgi:RNA 3'-terminal phosphate cyclase (ATP)
MISTGSLVLIDGSHGEGGGALVRTALAMAALTQQAVRIDQVRNGTNHPGIDIEDLTLIKALAKSCGAEVTGAEHGSQTISFLPTRSCGGLKDALDVNSNDQPNRVPNANVLLNALLPILARSGVYSHVSLSGETYGAHSLCFDYFSNVTLGAQRRFGLYAFPEQTVAGFGREGGGEVSLEVEPSALAAIDWSKRGDLIAARAVIAIGELPMTVAHRGLAHLTNLGINAKIPFEVDIVGVDSRKSGVCITTWVEYQNGIGGATAMGAKGVRIEAVAQAAFEDTLEWVRSGCSVDAYLADQILPTAVFAEGETTFTVSRLTKRFLTIVWVVKQFLPIHITVKGSEGEPGEVTIRR